MLCPSPTRLRHIARAFGFRKAHRQVYAAGMVPKRCAGSAREARWNAIRGALKTGVKL